ncbi:hypothetical protein NM962_06575 [Mycobacterium sp. SVM_VP21]|nr:hypothetical protein NM962_06575 [Mycobacterium sp. SVM_VP21]
MALRAVTADIALTSLGWPDVEVMTTDGWVTFDSAAAAQTYADETSATALSYGQTAVEWAGWLDPVLSFAGISGIEDWVSGRYDLFSEILSPGWNPLPWFEDYFSAISNDPEILFGPMADFNLGWLYGLLGISSEDGNQLDSLLELASGYYGGMLTWELMGVYAVVPGAINAVIDGTITLEDLFPEPGSQLDLLSSLAGESMLNWMTSTEATLSTSIENAMTILEGAPGVQWILDFVSQLAGDTGVELPF